MSAVQSDQDQKQDPIEGDGAECFRQNNASAAWPTNIREVLMILDRLAALGGLGNEDGAVPFLDRMLTLNQCAQWMQVKPKTLAEMVKQDVVPAVSTNKQESRWRFHPRTILQHGHAAFMRRKEKRR